MPTPVAGAGFMPVGPSAPAPPPGPDLGKDAFLRLLVAQLKYQNPMSPVGGHEFLAQSAQFTMLEKLDEIARQGAERAAEDGVRTAASLLGRRVTWADSTGVAASGVVTGSRFGLGGAVLLVGSTEIPLAAVREIHLS